ncbi:FecR domain-containing protein [Sphingobacterium sp. ML3W]|uniref:FecR family protein n=1 Tax=Sphingobacterium sp. ML3W TaxID=1538644 RepID=UPI00249AA4C8|nr:FecR family protein [Sphingobacterium sp. ML3W]WFA79157.1 FecR domain-containing protein [Sphingobacterium sp. ML3W]
MIESDKIVLAELIALKAKGIVLSQKQEEEIAQLLEKYPVSKTLIEEILNNGTIETPFDIRKIKMEDELARFQASFPPQRLPWYRSKKVYLWTGTFVAASLLLVIGIKWTQTSGTADYIVKDDSYGQKNDVLAGNTFAKLAIEGQDTLFLSVDPEQQLQTDLSIANNFLIYKKTNPAASTRTKHSLIVPKRATYQVELSDGTKVWLKPDSRLDYDANFSAGERRVKLQGEAFFVIAKDLNRPFFVESNGMEVKALGTQFNIRSYGGANPLVQLTEGKIKVKGKGKDMTIDAGHQILLQAQGLAALPLPNPEEASSWKDGFFSFKNKDMRQIMDEISRWYGVQLQIDCILDDKQYEGGINKNASLAQICSTLKDLTGYNFKIDSNILIINKT